MNLIIQKIQQQFRYLVNLASTFLSQIVSAVSLLILTPILVKELGPEKFGLYGVLLNVVVLSSVLDFGLNLGLLRKLVAKRDDSIYLINSLFFFFCFLFLLSIPIFFFLFSSQVICTGGSYIYYAVFTSVLVLQTVLTLLFDVIIQAANKIYIGKIIRISKIIIEFCCLFFLSKSGSVKLLLLASVLVNFLYIFSLFLFSKKEVNYILSIKNFKISILFEHIQYSFWYFLNALAGVLVFNGQVVMINALAGPAMATKYLVVTRFFDVVRIALTNFTTVLFPFLAAKQLQNNFNELKSIFLKVFTRVFFIAAIVIALLMTIGEQFFIIWSNHTDDVTLKLYQLMAIFIFLVVIDNVPTVFLNAFKLNTFQTIVGIVQGVLGIVIGCFLIIPYGIVGVGIASIISLFCTNLFFNPVYLIMVLNKKIAPHK